jgi:hypothetical protein
MIKNDSNINKNNSKTINIEFKDKNYSYSLIKKCESDENINGSEKINNGNKNLYDLNLNTSEIKLYRDYVRSKQLNSQIIDELNDLKSKYNILENKYNDLNKLRQESYDTNKLSISESSLIKLLFEANTIEGVSKVTNNILDDVDKRMNYLKNDILEITRL